MRLCQTRLAKRGGTEVWGIGFFSPCRWNSSPDKFEREGAEAHASYRRAKEPGKFISEKKFGSPALGATLRRGVLKKRGAWRNWQTRVGIRAKAAT